MRASTGAVISVGSEIGVKVCLGAFGANSLICLVEELFELEITLATGCSLTTEAGSEKLSSFATVARELSILPSGAPSNSEIVTPPKNAATPCTAMAVAAIEPRSVPAPFRIFRMCIY